MGSNMYGDLFVRILNISLISCYTIVVVMVVRALILRWERKYAYLLWFVVFVSLCIPFRIAGPFSLVPAWIADFDIMDKNESETDYLPNEMITEAVSQHHYYTPVTRYEEGEDGIPGTDSNREAMYVQEVSEAPVDYLPNETITETVSQHHYYTPVTQYEEGENGIPGTDSNRESAYNINDQINRDSRKKFLAFVWGVGVILLMAGNIRAVLKLRGQLKGAKPITGDHISGECAEKGVMSVGGIETPFLWGFLSPTIYLPQTIDEEERTYIIAHESYHRKRKDYIFKPLFFMIAVIHWFNPLVWAAYFLFVRDMEISCDEAVISSAGEDIRKKYAESLLKYAARQNGYTLTPITFGEPSLKYRIKNVLHYKESSMLFSAMMLCVVAVVTVGLVCKPRPAGLTVVPDYQEVPLITEDISLSGAFAVDKAAGEEDSLVSRAVEPQLENEGITAVKYQSGDMADNYQVGQEYELTDAEQVLLEVQVTYYEDDKDAFLDYCDRITAMKELAGSEETDMWAIRIGGTQGFDVYGTNVTDTIFVKTPEEKYLRIDQNFSANDREVPSLYEADFDTDGDQELMILGYFGDYGTETDQEQLFIVDKGSDKIWRAYVFHENIYLPMVQQYMDSAHSEMDVELLVDRDSDHCVSGIFQGNHFEAEFNYEGDGAWSLSEYRYEVQMKDD